MRKTLALLFIPLLFLACKPQQNGDANNTVKGDSTTAGNGGSVTVKPDSSATVENTDPAPVGGKEYTVSGKVMMTRSYCGGAAPSEEMLAQYRTPVPFPDLVLHVRSGKANDLKKPILRTTKTGLDGKYSFKLPAGEYCILIDERAKMPDPKAFASNIHYDADCFKEWVLACDATVKVVSADVSPAPITLHKKCMINYLSNCIRYVGPMPP